MNFSELRNYIKSIPDFGIPACDCIVYYKHNIVFRQSAGYRDSQHTSPVLSNDIYWCYSTTKVITCIAAMQLIESGKLRLTDPVSEYIPAYSNLYVNNGDSIVPCKNKMTIWNLFTMSGGIKFGIDEAGVHLRTLGLDGVTTTLQAVEQIAKEPLSYEPGTQFHYGYEHDVLAAVIEVVSGLSFKEYLRQNIWEPLEIENMYFYDTAPLNRISQFYVAEGNVAVPNSNWPVSALVFFDKYYSGGAGILTTVEDYGKFADALANGGVGFNGNRIISYESINLMRTNQLNDKLLKDYYAGVGNYGYGYGLGVRTLMSKNCNDNKSESPIGEFGWGGADGTYALIDTDNQLSVYYAQHVLGCVHDFNYQSHPHNKIRDIIYNTIKNN